MTDQESENTLPEKALTADAVRVEVQIYYGSDEYESGERTFEEVFQFVLPAAKPSTVEGWLKLLGRLQLLAGATRGLGFDDCIQMLECCIGYAHGVHGYESGVSAGLSPIDLSDVEAPCDRNVVSAVSLEVRNAQAATDDEVKLEEITTKELSELELFQRAVSQECTVA